MAVQQDAGARLLEACGSHLKNVDELAIQLAEAEIGGAPNESPAPAWRGVQESFALLAKEFADAEEAAAVRAADKARLANEAQAAEEQAKLAAAEAQDAAEAEAQAEQHRARQAAEAAEAADAEAAAAEARKAEAAKAQAESAAAAAAATATAAAAAAAAAATAPAPAPAPAAASTPVTEPAPKTSLFGGAPAAKSSLFGGAPKTSLFANASQSSDSNYGTTSAKQRLLNRMQDDDSDGEEAATAAAAAAAAASLQTAGAGVAPGADKWSVKAQEAAKNSGEKPKMPAMNTGMEGTFERDEAGNWKGTGISGSEQYRLGTESSNAQKTAPA